jgi:DNA-binding SARP family transcriptional activator
VEFRILGPLEVIGTDGRIVKIPPRERIVLSMLLLESEHIVSVERLVDAVWDDLPPATARKQILICISLIRKLLDKHGFGGEVLFRPPGYVLYPGEADMLDLKLFEAHAAAGRAAMREDRAVEAVAAFRQALAPWRGDPLAGAASRLIEMAAVGLTERRLSVAEMYADVRLRFGVYQDLVEDLRLLTATYPLRESLHSRLMRALAQEGRMVEAIEAYAAAHRTFTEELGIEPGQELRGLRSAMLAGRYEGEFAAHRVV